MKDKNLLILLYRRVLDYEKDPNPENWRTISGAKVHLDENGEIDGGAGGNFNGNYWDGKKGQQHLIGPHTMMKKNIGSGTTNVGLSGAGVFSKASKVEPPKQPEQPKLNAYEQHLQERKERYQELAEKARNKSNELWERQNKMMEAIPFGQPILVGHHSERSDRAYRKRIDNVTHQAMNEYDKAKYYEGKAKSVGTAGISGFDPDAVKKLEGKVEIMERGNEKYDKAIAALKKGDREQAFKELGEMRESTSRYLRMQDNERLEYILRNSKTSNNTEIRRIKDRINDLKLNQYKQESINSGETKKDNPLIHNDLYDFKLDDGRYQFEFDGKPSDEVRTILKSNGFKWSPSRGAWVRQATGNGQYGAKRAMEQLKEHMQKENPDFAKETDVSSVFKTEAPKPSGNVSEFESGPIGKGGYYVKFNGEPDEYDKLKLEKNGFKWNEKQGAFVHRSSYYAENHAQTVRKILGERYKWTNQEAEEAREKKMKDLLNKLYSNISFG